MTTSYTRPYGATNVALSSRNPRRSAEFYLAVLDSGIIDSDGERVTIFTPGASGLASFYGASPAGLGGSAHYGFRLQSPEHIRVAAAAVKAAGGEVIELGEFDAGKPYLFARDPDGYMFEIWYDPNSSSSE